MHWCKLLTLVRKDTESVDYVYISQKHFFNVSIFLAFYCVQSNTASQNVRNGSVSSDSHVSFLEKRIFRYLCHFSGSWQYVFREAEAFYLVIYTYKNFQIVFPYTKKKSKNKFFCFSKFELGVKPRGATLGAEKQCFYLILRYMTYPQIKFEPNLRNQGSKPMHVFQKNDWYMYHYPRKIIIVFNCLLFIRTKL